MACKGRMDWRYELDLRMDHDQWRDRMVTGRGSAHTPWFSFSPVSSPGRHQDVTKGNREAHQ